MKKVYIVTHDFSKDKPYNVYREYEEKQEAIDEIRMMLRSPHLFINIRLYEADKIDISDLEPMTREEMYKHLDE